MGGYKNKGFVEVLAAQQSPENPNWFHIIIQDNVQEAAREPLKHKGSFETVYIQDATGDESAARLGNVFTIGKGTKSWISLLQGKRVSVSNSLSLKRPGSA